MRLSKVACTSRCDTTAEVLTLPRDNLTVDPRVSKPHVVVIINYQLIVASSKSLASTLECLARRHPLGNAFGHLEPPVDARGVQTPLHSARVRVRRRHSLSSVALEMYVIKRDGREEPVAFDKITARIKKLSYGLSAEFCDPVRARATGARAIALERDIHRCDFER